MFIVWVSRTSMVCVSYRIFYVICSMVHDLVSGGLEFMVSVLRVDLVCTGLVLFGLGFGLR